MNEDELKTAIEKARVPPNARNFAIRLSPEQKEELKTLAKESGMTLSAYVEAVLREALDSRDVFKTLVVKKTVRNASDTVALAKS